jgi:hypothetical protein
MTAFIIFILVVGLVMGLMTVPLWPDMLDSYIEVRRKWDEYKKQRRFDAEEPARSVKRKQ